jgi:hypothetical protein
MSIIKNSSSFVYRFKKAKIQARARILFLICLLLTAGLANADDGTETFFDDSNAVGSVSLVLGRAYILKVNERLAIGQGSLISVGDQIYTDTNGHVHIRFIDNALVSVRPRSTLTVQRYDFDAENPSASAVKFDLVEGVARSISGEAAKAARQRFRLNTPVAAIGVRGTDFVVSADSRSTRALVNEGSIVMAPFSSLCSFEGSGPCSQNAVELASSTFQIIEMHTSNLLPRVASEQPLNRFADLKDRFSLASTPGGAADSDQADASTVYIEAAASNRVREASNASAGVAGAGPKEKLSDFTPLNQLSRADLGDSQLVWGRFGAGLGQKEVLSVDRLVAAEDRNVTIAASNYLLYRTEPSGARMAPNLGIVGFELDSAQAFYSLNGGSVSMRVDSGMLNVDFLNSEFSTALKLDHALTGIVDFSGGGRVADGGYLIGLDEAQSLLGAAATDGSEAGYFFERPLGAGSVSGLTLWGGP